MPTPDPQTFAGGGAAVARNRGESVNEVLIFDGDLVREGHGTYLKD